MSESAPEGQLNGEPISDAPTNPTEEATVTEALVEESASVPIGDIEVEAEMVVKKVEVLLDSLNNNNNEESVLSTDQTPLSPPETKTEEPTPLPTATGAPQDDRTEDQVTEIIEDDKLGTKAAAAALSAPSLEDVANLPEDETSKAEEPVLPNVETTAPVDEESGVMKQLEIVLKDEALLTAGDSITSEEPAPEQKSEVSEEISKKVSVSKTENLPDESLPKKVSKVEEVTLEKKPIKKTSRVGEESALESKPEVDEEIAKTISVSKTESLTEEKPVKKTSKFLESSEEPSKKISVSKTEEKPDKKVSKVEEAASEEKATKKFSKPAETVPEAPSKKTSSASVPEVPEKKVSMSLKSEERPVEKPGSRKGSLTVIQESEKSLTEEPKSEISAAETPDVSKSEATEPPKKKVSRYDKLEQQQPTDKLSKFGGRVGKKFSSKEEPKMEDEPQKAPRAKRSAAAKQAPPEEPPKAEEPAPVAEEPPAPAAVQDEEHVVEAVISLGATKEAPTAEEPASAEVETTLPSTEPSQEEPKKEEPMNEEPARKSSAKAQFSSSTTEQPSSKPEEAPAAVERKPSSQRVAYSASSSHVPAAATYSSASSGGRYTSSYQQPTHTKADYLPYYRHTPSYVSTFDNLVNISSFAQNLWPLEHSRSRSRLRERSRSKNRYQTPTRDYSLPSKFSGPAYDTAVSRSTSTSSLSGRGYDAYPLSRSSTLRVYGGTPPADTISHFYTNQDSSVDRFVNKINEPLSTYQYRNYSSSFYHPPYPSYTRAFSFDKPITYGNSYSSGYGSYGRPYYPSYESRPFISGLRASRFDTSEGRYHPTYSFSRGIALTSGPLMSRSGYW
uniref:Uncharacterized protein n=1 Tax=Romanomermis culicivorax TaxID=13658 RepID=A0A915JJH2_ROMCU